MTHKYNIGIIGNCSYIAYITERGEVCWLCLPRFDSGFLFGSLLDKKKGGDFSILPADNQFDTRQYYLENTNILCSEFTNSSGIYRIIDYAPRFYQYDRYFKPLMLFRKIEIISGNPKIVIRCNPVGDYGALQPSVVMGSNHIRYLGIGPQVRLTTSLSINHILEEKPIVLSETAYCAFTYGIPLEASLVATAEDFLEKTRAYWLSWVKTTSVGNIFQEHIIRSALALKLHQYEDTGGIIASGSMGLPEAFGSGRNWDYRYCWLRDAFYTLNAFNTIGHFEELERYFYYIRNIISEEREKIQPLYGITGAKEIVEREIELEGYRNNRPVRVGNDAYSHVQNDVYGQVLVSLLPLYIDKRLSSSPGKTPDMMIINWLLDKISSTMNEPDSGIWEFRNKQQRHCYTFLFHWAGSMAAKKIAEHQNDKKLLRRARNLASLASRQIEACYNPIKQAYCQAIESDQVDASCFQLIISHYLKPNSIRTKNHLKALERELSADGGLIYRYRHCDDFGAPKSAFLVCSFWYVESLACIGQIEKAIGVFEKLLSYSNHLKLFSEDIDPATGSQMGNFPQAYSHVGLMNAASRIGKKLDLPYFL